MPAGKSGILEFQSRDYRVAVRGSRFRLSYSETYDISGNYSDITFSNFQVAGVGNYGRVVLSGIITVNGTEILRKQDTDIGLVASGDDNFVDMIASALGFPQTVRVTHNSDGKKTIGIAISALGYDYFNLWFDGPSSGTPYTAATQNLVLTDIPRGMVRIHNGSSFDRYSVYIYNGSSWDRYRPHIFNGSAWEPYDGG